MAYGDDGEILNSLNFKITSLYNYWGPFPDGTAAFPGGKFPVNQGTDHNPIWYFGTNTGGTNQWTASSVEASSSIGTPNVGIENSGALVNLTDPEIYVKAQLFIVNTVTNTAGATLTIPVTGLNTSGGATIIVPYATWQPLQATGQQHKIVMKVYIAHFYYFKGCWSGGNYAARSHEETITAAELVPTGAGNSWEKGWVDNVSSPIIANWGSPQQFQQLSRVSAAAYQTAEIHLLAFLNPLLPEHPVYGSTSTNNISGGNFSTPDTLKVNVIWGMAAISAGLYYHSLGLKTDGTVVAVGDNGYGQCNVSSWTNIIAISAGYDSSLGLKSDRTVVAVGQNDLGQLNVSSWTNIIAISAGAYHSLGLKPDRTVVAVGNNDFGAVNVGGWTNIIAISAGAQHSLGLKSDGTVVAVGSNYYGQLNVGSWTNIIAIAGASQQSLGLKTDGTVVAVGFNTQGQLDVGSWTNIIAIAGGAQHSLGLKSDGTVVAVGSNYYGQLNVSGWTNIIAIAAGLGYSLGLKSDGTVVAVGYNGYGQLNVGGWDLIS